MCLVVHFSQFLLTIVRLQLWLEVFQVEAECSKDQCIVILGQFDLAVKDTLEAAMGPMLTPVQWYQASLPITRGAQRGWGRA